MTLNGLMMRSTAFAAVVTAALAGPAAAQRQRTLFEWNGQVDREVQIVMRGREVFTRGVGNNDRGRGRPRVESVLPRENGYVNVEMNRGRGDVDVVQQPSSRNDYTTIIRIRDRSSGRDGYHLVANWMPSGNGGRGNGRWEQGRDRDREGNGGWQGNNNGGGRQGDRGNGSAHWSGRVDDEIDIRIQGRRVDTFNRSGNGVRDVQFNVSGMGIPRNNVALASHVNLGRGQVMVIQQPTYQNDYTAIVRIRDPQGGYGTYDFDLSW